MINKNYDKHIVDFHEMMTFPVGSMFLFYDYDIDESDLKADQIFVKISPPSEEDTNFLYVKLNENKPIHICDSKCDHQFAVYKYFHTAFI